MGFKLIFAGMLFFFNPCVNIFDVLPDFIGCILISLGLLKLADIDDRFFTARRISNRLIAIYIVKLILSFYLPARWKSGLLPITFVFSVGEIILMIMLITSLFGAAEYVASRHGGEAQLKSINDTSKLTLGFMIIKNVAAFVPEAFSLAGQTELDLSHNARVTQTLEMAKPYTIVFLVLLVLVCGIYCAYLNARLFVAFSNNTILIGNLKQLYKQRVLDNPELLNKRAFNRYFSLMIVASVMLIDPIVDAINLLPDVLAYILIIIATAFLCGRAKTVKLAIGSIPLLATSAICSLLRTLFDSGVNYRMGYESYLTVQNTLVDSGVATLIVGAISLAESLLLVVLVWKSQSLAASKFADLTGEYLSPKPITIATGLLGASSCVASVTPYIKSMYHTQYVNDTLKNAHLRQLEASWELVQGWANIACIVLIATIAAMLIKQKRKADFSLKSESL